MGKCYCRHTDSGTWHPYDGNISALFKAEFGNIFPVSITLQSLFSWGWDLPLAAHGIVKEVGLRITPERTRVPFSVHYSIKFCCSRTIMFDWQSEPLTVLASTLFHAFNCLQICVQSLGLWRCNCPITHCLTSVRWPDGEGLLGSHVYSKGMSNAVSVEHQGKHSPVLMLPTLVF